MSGFDGNGYYDLTPTKARYWSGHADLDVTALLEAKGFEVEDRPTFWRIHDGPGISNECCCGISHALDVDRRWPLSGGPGGCLARHHSGRTVGYPA